MWVCQVALHNSWAELHWNYHAMFSALRLWRGRELSVGEVLFTPPGR